MLIKIVVSKWKFLNRDCIHCLMVINSKFLFIRVVQATVSSAGIDTSDIGKLLETILVQLRPVVLGEVRNALKTSTYPLDAQSLTVRIVKELRPFVSEALKKEIAAITVKTQKAQTQVISEVKAELEPAVLKVYISMMTIMEFYSKVGEIQFCIPMNNFKELFDTF